MRKKFMILLILVSTSLTLGLMSNTYSRYVADTDSNVVLELAKWQILVNENDITNNTTSSINLTPVIEENENVTNNTIAPSSKGYFDIDIDPTNVDVSFNYSINLNVLNENMPDLMISKYAILDNDYFEGDLVESTLLENNTITGTFDNTTPYQPFTIRVYFEWYEGIDENMTDEMDTAIGNDAAVNDTNLQINATIQFEQKI